MNTRSSSISVWAAAGTRCGQQISVRSTFESTGSTRPSSRAAHYARSPASVPGFGSGKCGGALPGRPAARDRRPTEQERDMSALTMQELLEAGVHFGHQTKRWNPKMQKYIFGERNGIYIIDLQKTLKKFREAYGFVRELAAGGGSLLFIGTKKQAQDTVLEEATRCGGFYVNQRWLGGT